MSASRNSPYSDTYDHTQLTFDPDADPSLRPYTDAEQDAYDNALIDYPSDCSADYPDHLITAYQHGLQVAADDYIEDLNS